jgi:hypothetical protein
MSLLGLLLVAPLLGVVLFLLLFVGGGAVAGKALGLGVLRGVGLGGVGGGSVLTLCGLGLAASFESVFRGLVERGVLNAGRPDFVMQGIGAIVWAGCFLAGVGFVLAVGGMFLARSSGGKA